MKTLHVLGKNYPLDDETAKILLEEDFIWSHSVKHSPVYHINPELPDYAEIEGHTYREGVGLLKGVALAFQRMRERQGRSPLAEAARAVVAGWHGGIIQCNARNDRSLTGLEKALEELKQ